jgi:hypothetical protein
VPALRRHLARGAATVTRRYLDRVYRGCSRGLVELRTNTGQRTWTELGHWSPLGPFVTAAVNAGEHVYHGLATRRDPSSGKATNLAELPMVWADIDAPPSEVRQRLDAFPFRYTLLVSSGYGAHVSFELREPLELDTPADVERAASLQRRLAAYLGADERATNPAVAPRLPGTRNFKYGAPRPVALIDETAATVHACELEDVLPAARARSQQAAGYSSIPVGARNDQLYAIARSLRARGLDWSAINATVRAVNDKICDEPLDETEILSLLKYALVQPDRADFVRYQEPGPVPVPAPSTGKPVLGVPCLPSYQSTKH